ncbi:hypothetical protein LTR86_000040 [Recurvomyces mirabilis]|nr:hypothetical protein LTR86_000040 [Recurvomyces mirabilis]
MATNIDAARVAHTRANMTMKACTFRLASANATLYAAQSGYRAALADLKNEVEHAQLLADKASAEMKLAQHSVKQNETALVKAQDAEGDAKQVLNQALTARSRRVNKQDVFEPALPAEDAPVLPQSAGEKYIAAAEAAFEDLENLDEFPEPEAEPCGNASCARNTSSRALTACPHNLAAGFAGLSAKDLKAAKKVFSPEQFGGNTGFKNKAYEVCAAVDKLIAVQVLNQTRRWQQGKAFDKNRRMDRGH